MPKHSLVGLLALSLAFVGCAGDDETAATDDTDTDPIVDEGFAFADDAPSAYDRIDRVGMPAIATAVIASKDDYNQADPADDANGDFVGEIVASLEFLHGALDDDLTALGLTPCAVTDCVTTAAPLVVPDTIKIDTTAMAGFPNGRLPADPVIDVTLAVVLLDLTVHSPALFAELPLNPPANDKAFPPSFPYIAAPH